MLVKTIREKFENFAPLNLAESWDNSGWQIKIDESIHINKVLLTISVTLDVINFAIDNDYKFIVAHHPVIFPNPKASVLFPSSCHVVLPPPQSLIPLLPDASSL